MTYAEFWHRYLRAHARKATRRCTMPAPAWRSPASPPPRSGGLAFPAGRPGLGYGFAWTAHGLVEGNRPETFGHPFWSLASDVRMLALAATGRLQPHLAAAGRRLNDSEAE